jgi:hypothetical protein
MRDAELRSSLLAIGPLLPALEYDGGLLDGRRRVAFGEELGLSVPVKRVRTLRDACSHLWPLHPQRALELAGDASLLELAELCGVEPTSIALVRRTTRPKRVSDTRRIRYERKQPAKLLQLWLEPQLRELMNIAGDELDLSLSELTRQAIWEKIALVVPHAPLHRPKHIKAKPRSECSRFATRRVSNRD